ncbi:hypothetical protein ACFYYR_00980 [Streptomyces sp. NPDC001922]|uniref:hypothetical protein n=1 Tax=Streptomyces sp. NPDC001922 TaxID=3364624 RepID=UPI00369DC789
MTHTDAWQHAKERYPLGSTARGVVKVQFNFGVFLELEHAPEVNGFIDLASYSPSGAGEGEKIPLPGVGETVEGAVVRLVDRDQQIRLRVGAPFWEGEGREPA